MKLFFSVAFVANILLLQNVFVQGEYYGGYADANDQHPRQQTANQFIKNFGMNSMNDRYLGPDSRTALYGPGSSPQHPDMTFGNLPTGRQIPGGAPYPNTGMHPEADRYSGEGFRGYQGQEYSAGGVPDGRFSTERVPGESFSSGRVPHGGVPSGRVPTGWSPDIYNGRRQDYLSQQRQPGLALTIADTLGRALSSVSGGKKILPGSFGPSGHSSMQPFSYSPDTYPNKNEGMDGMVTQKLAADRFMSSAHRMPAASQRYPENPGFHGSSHGRAKSYPGHPGEGHYQRQTASYGSSGQNPFTSTVPADFYGHGQHRQYQNGFENSFSEDGISEEYEPGHPRPDTQHKSGAYRSPQHGNQGQRW